MEFIWQLLLQLLVAFVPTVILIVFLLYVGFEYYLKKKVRNGTLLVFTDPNGVQRTRLVQLGGKLKANVDIGNTKGSYIIKPEFMCRQEYPMGLPSFLRESVPVYYFNTIAYSPIDLREAHIDNAPSLITQLDEGEEPLYEAEAVNVDVTSEDAQVTISPSMLRDITDEGFLDALLRSLAAYIESGGKFKVDPMWVLATAAGALIFAGAAGFMSWTVLGQVGELSEKVEIIHQEIQAQITPVKE